MRSSLRLQSLLCLAAQVLLATALHAEEPRSAPRAPELEAENQRLLELEAQLLSQLKRGAERQPTPPAPPASPSAAPTVTPEFVAREAAVAPTEAQQAAAAAGIDHLAALDVNATQTPAASPPPKRRRAPESPKKQSEDEGALMKASIRPERSTAPARHHGLVERDLIPPSPRIPAPSLEAQETQGSPARRPLRQELEEIGASLAELRENDRQIKRLLENLRDEVDELGAGVRISAVRAAAESTTTANEPRAGTKTMIATVVNEPAVLRSAPSRGATRIMSLARGTRLQVELHRGSWYRVVSPNGFRAWLPADVLIVNPLP